MRSSSKVIARKAGLLTSGEIDSVRLVGPIEPATNRGRSGVFARPFRGGRLRNARALDVQLVRHVLEQVVGLGDRRAAERIGLDDVGAGREILAVDLVDDVRTGEDQQVVVALEVLRVVPEPFAAEVRLRELVTLDHRPHRAVEDQDPRTEREI